MPLGWIDFSQTERSKVLSVLDLLSADGTLDELGIAPIRDGFSNLFFPGTSTVQTRAKYFFIVPYALRQLERNTETNPYSVLHSLDAIERRCAETMLKANRSEDGLIGKISLQNGKWVKRTPADIYWAGLRRYGIFTGGNLSLAEYVHAMCVLKNQKNTVKKLGNRNDNAEENEKDDKNSGDITSMHFWNIPTYKDEWFPELSMKLTREEGEFLKKQMIGSCPGSILAYILQHHMTDILDCGSFQSLEAYIGQFPEKMQRDYRLALKFSDFLIVIRTIYNVIVSDGQNEDANKYLEDMRPQFANRADIDIDQILMYLHISNNPMLSRFLKDCQRFMISGDVEAMKKCIHDREVYLKGENRAKTSHPGELAEGWYGGGELDYRFRNAKRLIRDIFESEGNDA